MVFKIKYKVTDAVKFVVKSKKETTVADLKAHYGCSMNTAMFLFSQVASLARAGEIPVQYVPKKGHNSERVVPLAKEEPVRP